MEADRRKLELAPWIPKDPTFDPGYDHFFSIMVFRFCKIHYGFTPATVISLWIPTALLSSYPTQSTIHTLC